MTDAARSPHELASVRAALRDELLARGLRTASDTLGLRRDLYVTGPNDLARALFALHTDAGDAAEQLYRGSGSWAAGMPPRFVVLPANAATDPSLEMLQQMRTIPVFYELDPSGGVTFRDLDALLAENLRD